MARRFRDIVAEVDAVWRGEKMEPTAGAFLAELSGRATQGDPTYLPPEHGAGPLDERALAYSVAALLTEGLADRRAPAALCAVLGRAGSVDPARRFTSLRALGAELEWFVITEQEGIVALPAPRMPSRPERSIPAVVVHPRALIPSRRAVERDLETAIVPRLVFDPPVPPRPAVEPRRERRRKPRRSPDALRLLGIAAVLMIGSALATAALVFVLTHASS